MKKTTQNTRAGRDSSGSGIHSHLPDDSVRNNLK